MLFSLEPTYALLLILCLACACAFEFVNGFHDTANAVATVIYTNALKPMQAVVLSGILNFVGVMIGGIGVAMGIVNLLPVETLVDQNIHHSLAMVFSILGTAIFWNLGTWWLGLPASSSHTLIGSILGVGLAFSLLPDSTGSAVNWSKAGEIGLSLLVSPVFGFSMTVFLMFILRRLVDKDKDKDQIFKEPKPGKAPPMWIRSILWLTCAGVSLSHGVNDGQKGVGLMMLILIGIVPAHFALDARRNPDEMRRALGQAQSVVSTIDTTRLPGTERYIVHRANAELASINSVFTRIGNVKALPEKETFGLRKSVLLASREVDKLLDSDNVRLSQTDRTQLKTGRDGMRTFTDYSPRWVTLLISISLGLGTMVGWKRIVQTIGEKIGKQHLTYAQGASAELVAASTIGLASAFQLPVSTTHVLSSGIAGSMVANKGLKNLQPQTVRNIVMAWLLTLPVTVTMSGTLYLILRWII